MEPRAKVLHWKDRSHRFAPHFHTEFYACAIVRGRCEFMCGGRAYAAAAGDLVLVDPFEVDTAGCSPEVEYRAVYFDDVPGAPWLSFTRTVVPASPLARRLAQVLGGPLRGEDLDACLQDILQAHAVRKEPDEDLQLFRRRVEDALEEIHAEEGVAPIARLAARLGMSAQHFSRTFHRVFGVPPVFFRNQLRLHRAEQQLRRGRRPAQVAAECGFSDQAHLIREFKKVRGITPRLYATAYRHLA